MEIEETEEKIPTINEEIEKFYTDSLEIIEKRRGTYWYQNYLRREVLGKYSQHQMLVNKASRLEGDEKVKTLNTLRNLKKELKGVIKEVTEYGE